MLVVSRDMRLIKGSLKVIIGDITEGCGTERSADGTGLDVKPAKSCHL